MTLSEPAVPAVAGGMAFAPALPPAASAGLGRRVSLAQLTPSSTAAMATAALGVTLLLPKPHMMPCHGGLAHKAFLDPSNDGEVRRRATSRPAGRRPHERDPGLPQRKRGSA